MNKFMIIIIIALLFDMSNAEYWCDTTFYKTDTVINCSTRTSDGFLTAVESYRNGKRHGVLLEWYKNGQIKWKERFLNGCPVDTSFVYHKNGKIKRITPYKNCKQHGLFLLLSESGDTLAKGMSNNGKNIGIHYAWWSKGKPEFKINYNSSGQKHGLTEEWREDGTRKDSIVYENGDIIEVRRYFTNGRLQYHKYQKPVNRDINAVYYDPKGKKVGEVKNGKGTYISYSEDGKSARRVYMENDEVVKIEKIDVE